jgi:hypothetical protein
MPLVSVVNQIFYFSSRVGLSDSESDSSSLERKRGAADPFNKNRKPQTHKKRPKKRVAIPVSTPKIPMGFESNSGMGAAALMYQKLKNEINSSMEKGKIMTDDPSLSSPLITNQTNFPPRLSSNPRLTLAVELVVADRLTIVISGSDETRKSCRCHVL